MDLEIITVGSRGILFHYSDVKMDSLNEPVNIYVINGKNHLFICDTHLGPDVMKEVVSYLDEQGMTSKPIIVFNSHYDPDHVFGNCFFKDELIISHSKCRSLLETKGEELLEQFEKLKKGNVEIVLPNVVFEKRISFEDEGIEFLHTPAHTEDSSSCIDYPEKILFAGDNILLEPLPYLDRSDVAEFKETLEFYKSLLLSGKIEQIVTTHTDIVTDTKQIDELLNYLENYNSFTVDISNYSFRYKLIHYNNLSEHAKQFQEKGNNQQAIDFSKAAFSMLTELEPEATEDLLKQIVAEKERIKTALSELEE